jgi:glycosyltransferase involved in cell wall biosynthesis
MFAVNVIGFVSADFGLGIAARMTVAALVEAGIPVAVVDAILPDGRSRADNRYAHLYVSDTGRLPHPVNLVHMNPMEAAGIRRQFPHWFTGGFTAIVPFWELPVPPDEWLPLLDQYDAVLSATWYMREIFAAHCSVPVRHYPIGIRVDAPAPRDGVRARFSIAASAFAVYANFDLNSSIGRKNPQAVVAAFRSAFAGDRDAVLVLKVNGQPHDPQDQRFIDECRASADVRIVFEHLSYAEVLSLTAACDAYISLHRAEGLGLGPMEAMALGVPVIATAWSGPMDYLDDASAILIPYRMIRVVDRLPDYRAARMQGVVSWADPDIASATQALRALRSDAPLRARLIAGGRAAIARRNERFFSRANFEPLAALWQRTTSA